MNNDDILFGPVGMAVEDKEFIWEIIVVALGGNFNDPFLKNLKHQFFNDLNEAGLVEFLNKQEIRDSLYERR